MLSWKYGPAREISSKFAVFWLIYAYLKSIPAPHHHTVLVALWLIEKVRVSESEREKEKERGRVNRTCVCAHTRVATETIHQTIVFEICTRTSYTHAFANAHILASTEFGPCVH